MEHKRPSTNHDEKLLAFIMQAANLATDKVVSEELSDYLSVEAASTSAGSASARSGWSSRSGCECAKACSCGSRSMRGKPSGTSSTGEGSPTSCRTWPRQGSFDNVPSLGARSAVAESFLKDAQARHGKIGEDLPQDDIARIVPTFQGQPVGCAEEAAARSSGWDSDAPPQRQEATCRGASAPLKQLWTWLVDCGCRLGASVTGEADIVEAPLMGPVTAESIV